MLPRLSPLTSPFELTVSINKRLHPYFKAWYQRKKDEGETPEQFALRILKQAAMNDYLADVHKSEADKVEILRGQELDDLTDDARTIGTEVD